MGGWACEHGGGQVGQWAGRCVCMSDQVLPSLMNLYMKKTEICSLYRRDAGEKILHMESFAWLHN